MFYRWTSFTRTRLIYSPLPLIKKTLLDKSRVVFWHHQILQPILYIFIYTTQTKPEMQHYISYSFPQKTNKLKGHCKFVPRMQPSLLDFTIAILEKTHKFLVFLGKMKEKNLPNEYEPLFIPKGL